MAQISAELDEERDKSTSLQETVANLQKTNEELCESQMSLQTKLVQRYCEIFKDDLLLIFQRSSTCLNILIINFG